MLKGLLKALTRRLPRKKSQVDLIALAQAHAKRERKNRKRRADHG